MATRDPAAAIFERDPKNKWEGGKPDKLMSGASGEELKRTLYREQRVLKSKVDKLTKMLLDKNLNTAERYALKKSLAESNAAIKKVADASTKELEFLKSSQRYQQEAVRKLGNLREFMRAEAARKTGPLSAKEQKKRDEQIELLERVDKRLTDLSGKDIGTNAGRLGTLKTLSRLDADMKKLPEELQRIFAKQEQFTQEAVELQRKVFDAEMAERKKKADEQAKEEKKRAEAAKKDAEKFVNDQRRKAEQKAEEERKRAEAAALQAEKQKEDRLSKGYAAYKSLQDGRKRRTDKVKNAALGALDRVGYGKFSIGTAVRGGIAANNLRKNWRDGKTSFQKYMQTRALAAGSDPSRLRFGLGRVEKDDDEEERYRARMSQKWGGAQSTQMGGQTVSKSSFDDENMKDQLDTQQEISNTLKNYVAQEARFNSRMLDELKRKTKDDEPANDDKFGLSKGGLLSNLAKGLPALLASVLPGLIAALAPALLLKLGLDQKKAIEADPTNKKFDDNSYARVLRGKADSVGQAAAMQQQKALKTLQPGVAKQYLEAGLQPDGKYLDGYSKQQLEDMAAGRKPDTASMEQFVKIQTGAQQAASSAQASADDNADTQRMAARSAVSIPDSGSSGAQAVGTMGKPMGSSPKSSLPSGAVGSGGMIAEGMGKIFTKSSGVDTDGVNPQLQSKLSAMGQEYYEKTGKKINFNSAYRSMEKQAELFKKMKPGMAAKPGSSLHNYGLAVDIPQETTNELDKLGLLSKYGLERPIRGEPWHVQPKGVSVAAARAGIYSADAPSDQGGSTPMAKATQTAANVTDAQNDPPPSSAATAAAGTQQAASGGNGQTSANSASVSSIPTFDDSDGVFLAMNLGVVA